MTNRKRNEKRSQMLKRKNNKKRRRRDEPGNKEKIKESEKEKEKKILSRENVYTCNKMEQYYRQLDISKEKEILFESSHLINNYIYLFTQRWGNCFLT